MKTQLLILVTIAVFIAMPFTMGSTRPGDLVNYTWNVTDIPVGNYTWNVEGYGYVDNNASNLYYGSGNLSNYTFTITSGGGGDTCTAPAAGNNWVVRWNDNCSITTNINLGEGNLSINGTAGRFTIFGGNITANRIILNSAAGVRFIITSGGLILYKI